MHIAGRLPDGAHDACVSPLRCVSGRGARAHGCAGSPVGRLVPEALRGLRWSTMVARLVYETRTRRRSTALLPPRGHRAAFRGGSPLQSGARLPLRHAPRDLGAAPTMGCGAERHSLRQRSRPITCSDFGASTAGGAAPWPAHGLRAEPVAVLVERTHGCAVSPASPREVDPRPSRGTEAMRRQKGERILKDRGPTTPQSVAVPPAHGPRTRESFASPRP